MQALEKTIKENQMMARGGPRAGSARKQESATKRQAGRFGTVTVSGKKISHVYSFQKSPRCSATSKRTRRPCMAPAVTVWTVCRFHGAQRSAPRQTGLVLLRPSGPADCAGQVQACAAARHLWGELELWQIQPHSLLNKQSGVHENRAILDDAHRRNANRAAASVKRRRLRKHIIASCLQLLIRSVELATLSRSRRCCRVSSNLEGGNHAAS